MSRSVTITLPLPPRELSPNARVHYMAKARAVKKYRRWAATEAQVAMGTFSLKHAYFWTAATVRVRWFTRTRRRPDADNALASLKAAFDGMADAGLFANDRGLTHKPIVFAVDKANPRVEITVTCAEEESDVA